VTKMTAEQMIAAAKKNVAAIGEWDPVDALGNTILENDIVCVGWNNNGPLYGRVVKIERGGLSTPDGVTLTRTSIICNPILISGQKSKGANRLGVVVKTINPTSQALVEGLATLPLGKA
jgi:hypothetical protein